MIVARGLWMKVVTEAKEERVASQSQVSRPKGGGVDGHVDVPDDLCLHDFQFGQIVWVDRLNSASFASQPPFPHPRSPVALFATEVSAEVGPDSGRLLETEAEF